MSLYVVATPIGHPDDISRRAKEALERADTIIGEEAKPTRKLLKSAGVSPSKPIELLNEHSDRSRIEELGLLCRSQEVALVSDCGTPGFCDPGAELVNHCHNHGILVRSLPGPSSLMAFLSICGHRLINFYFQGFLPANTEERRGRLGFLKQRKETIILMDTPYRLKKTLENCKEYFSSSEIVLGVNLSKDSERIYRGKAVEILNELKEEKAEFVLAVVPN